MNSQQSIINAVAAIRDAKPLKPRSLRLHEYAGYDKPGKVVNSWDLVNGLEKKILEVIIKDMKDNHPGDCYLFLEAEDGQEEPLGWFRVSYITCGPKKRMGIHKYLGQGVFCWGNIGPEKLKNHIVRGLQRMRAGKQ